MNDTDLSFELELIAMANGGSALGRHDGRAVFVPYTIPGERVRVRITEERGRVAFAEGLTLIEASADRVFPTCPHFGPGRCGRCQWQHIRYEAQLLLKLDVLADQLSRIGGFSDSALEQALQPVIASASEWGYANHLTLSVTPDGLALPRAGLPGSVAIDECRILNADLEGLLDRVQFDSSSKVQRIRLARGSDGALMLVLYVLDADDVPEMELDFTASVNLILPDNVPVNLIGDLALTVVASGRQFRVTAGSFIRANYDQLSALSLAVAKGLDLRGGETVLDLYGGIGMYSAAVAQDAAAVTLVESYPTACDDARHNLADLPSVQVVESTVEHFLTEQTATPDRVIVDPPPEGLSLAAIDALTDMKIPRIVYVSSDAATLGRDAKRLSNHGYRLESVQPIDLSPQTYYVDSVVTMAL